MHDLSCNYLQWEYSGAAVADVWLMECEAPWACNLFVASGDIPGSNLGDSLHHCQSLFLHVPVLSMREWRV